MSGNKAVDARCKRIHAGLQKVIGNIERRQEETHSMAKLFVVPRLFLISKREADRPRLARTLPGLLPPGGVRTFPARKQGSAQESDREQAGVSFVKPTSFARLSG
jgi:hypothetical protein